MRELKVHVERIVRPVQASDDAKLIMREELHTHLDGVYQQELARLEDSEAALAAAKERLGDPAELTREFQTSVPAVDRLAARFFGYRWHAQESWLRYAGRISAGVWIGETAFLLVLMQVFGWLDGLSFGAAFLTPESWAVLAVALVAIPVGVCFVTGMWTSWHGVYHVRRSRWRAFAYSTALGISAWAAGPGLAIWATQGPSMFMIWTLLFMLGLASALPLLIAIATNPLGKRLQRCQEWERLEIGD